MSMTEKWKRINGFHDYAISSAGRVQSFKRSIYGTFLKASKNSNGKGYLHVHLYNKNEPRVQFSVHSLVATHFVSGKFPNACVDHIDMNTLNNNYTNLEWVTQTENMHRYWSSL